MDFIKQIERINIIHKLISVEQTGTPLQFAKKLKLSKSQMYNVLDTFKDFNAPVKYCKKRESFYYSAPFILELKYSLKICSENEAKEIYGGFIFRPLLLDGTILNLTEQKF